MLGGKKSIQELAKHLVSVNKKLVENTALTNCHVVGLNSFIINERPRIRLFIADKYCKLYDGFDIRNPIIPIHPHKYDDLFFPLSGTLTQHIYKPFDETNQYDNSIDLNKYKYGRISDSGFIIENLGKQKLEYLGGYDNLEFLKASELHTVSLDFGNEELCSWLIFEANEDKNFKQVAYHQDLKKQDNLYLKFTNPIHYLNDFFNTLRHK